MAPLVTSERRKEEGRRAAVMAAAAIFLALACVLCLTLLASGDSEVQEKVRCPLSLDMIVPDRCGAGKTETRLAFEWRES